MACNDEGTACSCKSAGKLLLQLENAPWWLYSWIGLETVSDDSPCSLTNSPYLRSGTSILCCPVRTLDGLLKPPRTSSAKCHVLDVLPAEIYEISLIGCALAYSQLGQKEFAFPALVGSSDPGRLESSLKSSRCTE
jgi:hypothetical protein